MGSSRVIAVAACLLFATAAPAAADNWLPHPADATWTYQWSDSVYSPSPSVEHVSVLKTDAPSPSTFTLAWTVDGAGNQNGCPVGASFEGWVQFQETNGGLDNGPLGWCGAPPPSQFPILCSSVTGCGNAATSTLYDLIWGSRSPILAEPLVQGAAWTSTGGFQNDVGSSSEYLGTESVSVPAFPSPVLAAKVRSEISQAGAIGDPYGSGIRTIWWVYGVGPVKIVFQHDGGSGAPVTTAVLTGTSLAAQSPPPNANWFPLALGAKSKFRWTNTKHLRRPEVQSLVVDQAANGSGRIAVSSTSGPIRVKGVYFYTLRNDGLTNLTGAAQAASLAKLPPLGPSALPASQRRHFFTVLDLMNFGFGPVLPAYPAAGASWSSDPGSRDFAVYGVRGTSRVLGIRKVTVPAGTFSALAVRTTMTQPGFPFGSGVRTTWFAPGVGLVKLVFAHRDGSTSVVVRLK